MTDGHVTLRAVQPNDYAVIDAGQRDPDVQRWIGTPWPVHELPARLERLAAEGSPTFAICESGPGLLGLVWLNKSIDGGATRSVGYWLLPEARGRGVATAAVRLISRWAVEELGTARLLLRTAPDNERSKRLAERAGFRRVNVPDTVDVVFELEAEQGNRARRNVRVRGIK
ncbi:MAG TPA: GNAT family N-acetyltransferase [Candidatus Limnocylindrales bacterium]|nr:GNAT family N-acetyltransferase [Candidatus Limnocylindrales bacterium]